MQTDDIRETYVKTAERLVQTLARISDRLQRSHALAARLKRCTNLLAIEIMRLIRDHARDGKEDFVRLYNSLLVDRVLAETMGEARAAQLAEEARQRGELWLVALLVELPAQQAIDQHVQPYLDPALREAPLGMRTFLARRPDPKMIERIARDQDHRVIRNLLSNPLLTEKDVVKIGATRPTSPKVLKEIYNHPKWIARYSVKKTLVFSPYTPLSISVRLLPYLTIEHLEQLCEMSDVNPILLEQALQVIREKTNEFTSDDVHFLP